MKFFLIFFLISVKIASASDSFNGGYVGFDLGIQSPSSLWHSDYLNTAYAGPTAFDDSVNSRFKSNGSIYGFHFGRNWVINQYLYGLEAKLNFGNSTANMAGIPGCAINCGGYTSGAQIDSALVKFGSGLGVNAKFGMKNQNNLATYGVVGVALTKITSSATCQLSGPDPVCLDTLGNPYSTSTNTKNIFGWSLGAGIEKLFDKYSVKAEYVYTQYNKISSHANFLDGTVYDYSVQPKRQTFILGVSYYY